MSKGQVSKMFFGLLMINPEVIQLCANRHLRVGILYGESILADEREKQRKQINDEDSAIYQDVYEYVEKI